jgi:multidrug resistance efflux pump
MDILLLGIYAFLVWLIFIKLKWLPWTTPWKVGVFIFPVVALATLLLLLNIFAPATTDVRVVKYVVPVVSQVRGRVIEVPVENNRPVKKGDVLFKVDPTPYQNEVTSLEAKLASDEAKVNAERQRLAETEAKLADVVSTEPQLKEQLNEAIGKIAVLNASLELARMRVAQNTELVKASAGPRFDLERAETDVKELTAEIAAARAVEQQVREKLSGRVKSGELAAVAQVRSQIATAQAQVKVSEATADTTRAQLENARWDLTQTTLVAPGKGTMVNVQLRPGFFVAGMPFNEVMTFVDDEYQIFALFGQNELHQVQPGNEADITLDTYPGRVVKAHVDSVIWAQGQGQGQVDASGNLPNTIFTPPPGRFPVKLVVGEQDRALFLAAGARGSAAIYTEHLTAIHILRKVLIRINSYLDYIIIKHAISLGH